MRTSTFLATLCLVFVSGCSTQHTVQGEQPLMMSSSGPNILNARTQPEVVVLNNNLQPTLPEEVTADVKDFKYPIRNVELKFEDLPLSIPMEHIAGTTWRAQFTPQQLQILAVSGKTVNYKADIVATNSQGDTAQSSDSLQVTVQSPLSAS